MALAHNINSIAFCCISTGVYGYPNNEAADVALKTCKEWLQCHGGIDRIVFCTYLDTDFELYRDLMAEDYFRCDLQVPPQPGMQCAAASICEEVQSESEIDFIIESPDVIEIQQIIPKVSHKVTPVVIPEIVPNVTFNFSPTIVPEPPKKRGRKAKKKSVPLAKKNYLTFDEITKKINDAQHQSIKVVETKCDLPDELSDDGFYYRNSKIVTILYTVGDDTEVHSITLDNLLQRNYMTFSDIENGVKDKEGIVLKIVKVQSDFPQGGATDRCYYTKLRDVMVFYNVPHDNEMMSIRLDHLLNRGFPESIKSRAVSVLEEKTLDDLVAKSTQPLEILSVTTDIEDSPQGLGGPWKYIDNHKVFITYLLNKKVYNVRLDHLFDRGFTTPEKKFKYYSFLHFKTLVAQSNNSKPLSEAIEDEAYFMDILQQVNLYYIHHITYVQNQEIVEFCGPQCHEDRFNLKLFHYYGIGKIKYYRWNDLYDHVARDYSQAKANKFKSNVANEDIVTEDRFEQYLKDINDNIIHNHHKYIDQFVLFSGPQCNEDRKNKGRVDYNVLFKQPSSITKVSYAQPQKKKVELQETFEKSGFSLRVCDICRKVRLLGARAATKYPLGFYSWQGEEKRMQFTCKKLFKLSCNSENDMEERRNLQIGNKYIAYTSIDDKILVGFFIEVSETDNVDGTTKIKVLKQLGTKAYPSLNENEIWLSDHPFCFGKKDGKHSRWKAGSDKNKFIVCQITIPFPHEAICCIPFHDSHFEHSNIDNDDPSNEISFGSLNRVYNIHLLLENLKKLVCVKCQRSVPGIENIDNIDFIEDGRSFPRSAHPVFPKSIKTIYEDSEVYASTTKFSIDPRFQTSNIYQSSDSKVQSICTHCSQYYDLEDGIVTPRCLVFENSQSQSQTGSESDVGSQDNTRKKEYYQKINPWGPENLFTLNLFNDEEYYLFMKTLTKAELMVVSPLIISIQVIRSRGSQMPFSKHGSIAFPLKSPMETKTLPWTDFKNLPFIHVYNQGSDPTKCWDAKINLNNIVRVKDYMERRCDHPEFPHGRRFYRFIGEGFCVFTGNQLNDLKDKLSGCDDSYEVPQGLRQHEIGEYGEKRSQNVPRAQVENWLNSQFYFADSIQTALRTKFPEDLFNSFWTNLKSFIIKKITETCIQLQKQGRFADSTENFKKTHLEDAMVTYDLLFEYFVDCKFVVDSTDVSNNIFEEFFILAASFSNDDSSNLLPHCGVIDTGEDPDEIIQRNISKTALERRPLQVNRAQPVPEWSAGYLQKAFPHIFLTGDADLYQDRPVSLNVLKNREVYLHHLSMMTEVQEDPQLIFVIRNMLVRLDSFQASRIFLKEVNVASIKIPTAEELEALTGNSIRNIPKFVMQYGTLLRDSIPWWKRARSEEIGIKRDLEHVREDVKYPTLLQMFRTMAFPYHSASYFHRLFGYDSDDDIKDVQKRRAKVLVNSTAIEWIGSLLAEIDLKYLAVYRSRNDYYTGRNENGANGNPHWHSVLYSKELGMLTWKLKEDMKNYFEEIRDSMNGETEALIWTQEEQATLKDSMKQKWMDCREELILFFKGQYVNWNPSYNSCSEPTGSFSNPAIETCLLSPLIDKSLSTANFDELDKLYCDIVQTHCRHIVHRGPNGLPSRQDYCYEEKSIKDKDKSIDGKVVKKLVVRCKRRKPQPKRVSPAIYADPHEKKYSQLSFECNDEWFNGADPFMILNNLGNCDTKALVPSIFQRKPTYVFSDSSREVEMKFYTDVSDGAIEYILKYLIKSPVPVKTDKEIFSKVTQSMDTLTESGVRQCYAQAAIQQSVSLLNAQHVNLKIPLLLRNTKCFRLNVLGRKTLKLLEPGEVISEHNYLQTNKVDEFEARLSNLSIKSAPGVREDVNAGDMSMHTFFDKYLSKFDVQNKKEVVVKNRYRVTSGRYNAIALVPFTTLIQANPKRPYYGEFCKKMCLWQKEYGSIRETIQVFSPDQKDEEHKYWIDIFNSTFPLGEGLIPIFKAFVEHFDRKSKGEVDSDSDIESEDDNSQNVVQDQGSTSVNAVKSKPNLFYQTNDDKLYDHTVDGDNEFADEFVKEAARLSNDYIANANLEDLTTWLLPQRATDTGLTPTIEARLRLIRNERGEPVPVNADMPLTAKQELVRRIIINWVTDKVGENKMPPLRLFVIGVPGAGKTFAFKVTASNIMSMLGDDWHKHVRYATPTGSVCYHMGFGASTLHRTFYIRVGKLKESYIGDVDKLIELMQRLPLTVFLIVFDESSMLSRELFAVIYTRLVEAQIDPLSTGFVFLGDPAQISPIGGISLWSTEKRNEDNKMCSDLSLLGLNRFREVMGMTRIDLVPGYQTLVNTKSKKKLSKQKYMDVRQEFGQNVYLGNYNAVFLDEIKRTDGSPESERFGKLLQEVRYGKFRQEHLNTLREMCATVKDVEDDSLEWCKKTLLTGFHFYSQDNPERENADSNNAKALVEYSRNTTLGILLFESVHAPAAQAVQLATLDSKTFQGMPRKLFLASKSPVILTTNLNPSLGLFNGAFGFFIGPLYIPKSYVVDSLEVLKSAVVADGITTKQVEITIAHGKRVQLPTGTCLKKINGLPYSSIENVLDNLEEPFTAEFEVPPKPPFLPDYIVIDFPEYSRSGGLPFFPGEEKKNYVCVKAQTRDKKSTQHAGFRQHQTRTGFPVELAFVMTAFKGIGANHTRTELRLKAHFARGGLFYVGISRVRNPKHIFIPDNNWPNILDLKRQRLNKVVLECENFERIVRVIGATNMRKHAFDLLTLPISIASIEKDTFNYICDKIHEKWLQYGVNTRDKNCKIEVYKDLPNNNTVTEGVFNEVYKFMTESDEAKLKQKVPYLKEADRVMLQNTDVKQSVRPTSTKSKLQSGQSKANSKPDGKSAKKQSKVSSPKVTTKSSTIPKPKGKQAKKMSTTKGKPQNTKAKVSKESTLPNKKPSTDKTKSSNYNNSNIQSVDYGLLYGLANSGAICYLNSALQMLRSVVDYCIVDCKLLSDDAEHISAFKRIMKAENNKEDVTHIINKLKEKYDFDPETHQDAHEALLNLFELYNSIIDETSFEITVQATTECQGCHNPSQLEEKHSFLHINLNSDAEHTTPESLQCLIIQSLMGTLIDGYNCDHCKRQTEAARSLEIIEYPRLLFIQIIRCSPDGTRKQSLRLPLDNVLKFDSVTYTLCSAISHKGSNMHSGHYIFFSNTTGQWLKYDDSVVRLSSKLHIPSNETYILCYVRSLTQIPNLSSCTEGFSQRSTGNNEVHVPQYLDFSQSGLKNFGQTCYLNSALQMLRSLPNLWLTAPQVSDMDDMDVRYVSSFRKIVECLTNDTDGCLEDILQMFRIQYSWFLRNQQDTHEALLHLFDFFSSIINVTSFDIVIEATTQCERCGNRSLQEEQHTFFKITLSTPVVTVNSVQNFIHSNLMGSRIEGYICEHCNRTSYANRSLSIVSYPEILFIQIVRFSYSHTEDKIVKNHFDVVLDHQLRFETCRYKLRSVICHIGETMGSGHYVAFVNSDGQWFKYSDLAVTQSNAINGSQMYILCYVKSHDSLPVEV